MRYIQNHLRGNLMSMMPEARSDNNGITFYNKQKGIVIHAGRDKYGNVNISSKKYNIIQNSPIGRFYLLSLVFPYSMLYYAVYSCFNIYILNVLFFILLIWFIVFSSYIIKRTSPEQKQTFKYHGAEHMVLNYYDKYHDVPSNLNDIKKMSNISIRCGSTLIYVGLLLFTFVVITYMLIPYIILKIISIPLCCFIVLYLWANGKCNYLQKLVVEKPGSQELEVAIIGMKEYIKTLN